MSNSRYGGNIDKVIIEANGGQIEFDGHDPIRIKIISEGKQTIIFKDRKLNAVDASKEMTFKQRYEQNYQKDAYVDILELKFRNDPQ